jgi:hypothetical protein
LLPRRSNEFTIWRDGDWKVIDHYLPNVKTMAWRRMRSTAQSSMGKKFDQKVGDMMTRIRCENGS